MAQLEHIEAIEKRLWSAADTLRANSNFAANEFFMPVMGLIFLRHAYSRFLMVRDEVVKSLPTRGGKTRALVKEDFSTKGAVFLRPEAQFDYLVGLPDSASRAEAIIKAMESIEEDYETLKGVLPKEEYNELDNEILGQLLRKLNPEELKKMSGDVFGRIYEYFLTQFAGTKAHDGGEFFTPVSLVSFIAKVLETESGVVLDPACGSGGMFVQSARVVERQNKNPSERLTLCRGGDSRQEDRRQFQGAYGMKNVVSKKSDRRPSLFARVVAKIYETPSSKFTLSWSHYVLLMRISDPVEYPRHKERRWDMRRGTIDVRRREARDVRRVSCLLSRVKNRSRLGANVSRPPNPPKGTHP